MALCLLAMGLARAQQNRFTVMVYNVENLFDADGIAYVDGEVQGLQR